MNRSNLSGDEPEHDQIKKISNTLVVTLAIIGLLVITLSFFFVYNDIINTDVKVAKCSNTVINNTKNTCIYSVKTPYNENLRNIKGVRYDCPNSNEPGKTYVCYIYDTDQITLHKFTAQYHTVSISTQQYFIFICIFFGTVYSLILLYTIYAIVHILFRKILYQAHHKRYETIGASSTNNIREAV